MSKLSQLTKKGRALNKRVYPQRLASSVNYKLAEYSCLSCSANSGNTGSIC